MLNHPVPDPFADPEMRDRAAKLVRLLGSDAAGEAEAARGALLRLLTRHGATAGDLAGRLLDQAPAEGQDDAPALRVVLAAAERRAALAEAAARTALAEAERLRAAAARLRAITVALGGIAALLVALAWLPGRGPAPAAPAAPAPVQPAVMPPPTAALAPVPPEAPPPASPAPAPPRPAAPMARAGRVSAPEGVLLRLDPVPGAPTVALLPQGTKVAIDQAFPMLGTDWMQVRSPQGAGFVPASTIGPE